MSQLSEEITHRFEYHRPKSQEDVLSHEKVRETCMSLALYIEETTPAGREQSLAITKIEEAMFWANAALARGRE